MAFKTLILGLALLPTLFAQYAPARPPPRFPRTTTPARRLRPSPSVRIPLRPPPTLSPITLESTTIGAVPVPAPTGRPAPPPTPLCTKSRQCGLAPRYCLMPFSPPQDDPRAPAVARLEMATCVDAAGFADCDPTVDKAKCGKAGVCLVRAPYECSVLIEEEGDEKRREEQAERGEALEQKKRPCGYCMELIWA
jgi:hypothetical protein